MVVFIQLHGCFTSLYTECYIEQRCKYNFVPLSTWYGCVSFISQSKLSPLAALDNVVITPMEIWHTSKWMWQYVRRGWNECAILNHRISPVWVRKKKKDSVEMVCLTKHEMMLYLFSKFSLYIWYTWQQTETWLCLKPLKEVST